MKPRVLSLIAVFLIIFFLVGIAVAGPYAPAAGQPDSGAIYMDDPCFVSWATGWQNYIIGNGDAGNGHKWVDETWQTPEKALGKAVGSSYDIVTLGRSGSITMTFDKPIVDGDGPDFAVFENSFSDTFLELGYVEVSTDGVTWYRFQNSSLTTAPVGGYGTVDPTNVYQLGCKYKQGYGEPYDLAQLMLGDDIEINYVRIFDVVGDGNSYDTNNHVIYDAYPTWGSAGFDLDAIGVIHQKVYVGSTASFTVAPASGTVPLTVQFTDTSTGDIDSWSWDFGDGESSTEENPDHTYQEPGDYTVTLIVLGPGERVSKTIQGIKVEAVPADQPELAAPGTPLAVTTFEVGVTLVNPGDIQVIISAGPIYLHPVIQVDAADRGQSATMFMYVYLPDSNVGFTLGQKSITLGDTVDFAQMLPQSIDLTGYEGLVFDIYCAYILNSETIKYDAYEVRVQ